MSERCSTVHLTRLKKFGNVVTTSQEEGKMIIHTTAEELEVVAQELGLEHEDFDRLAEYVGLVGNYSVDTEEARLDVISDNLKKWIDWETETYYGTHASTADFAQFYFENYDTESTIQPYLEVDWQKTWDKNLRHDFYYSDKGYVWAEVY